MDRRLRQPRRARRRITTPTAPARTSPRSCSALHRRLLSPVGDEAVRGERAGRRLPSAAKPADLPLADAPSRRCRPQQDRRARRLPGPAPTHRQRLWLLEIMRGSRPAQQGPWTKQGGYAGVAVGSAPIWFISVNTSQYCVISTMRPSWTRIRSHAANFTGRPVPLRPANSPWCVPL